MLRGIDISSWQTSTPVLAGLSFVFIRASFGTSPDPRYPQHLADVQHAGLPAVPYHTFEPGDPAAQVATFLGVVGGAPSVGIDLEHTYVGNATYLSMVKSMIDRLHAAGRKVTLYGSESGYPRLGQDYAWVAKWGAVPPSIQWDYWQWQGSPLDQDYFAGDEAALMVATGGPMYAVEVRELLAAPNPRPFTIPPNTRIDGYDPSQPNRVVRTFGPQTAPSIAHADATVGVAWYGTATQQTPHGYPFLHVTDGVLAGLLITAGLVHLDPAAPVVDQAALDAAKAAGFSECQTKAVAAVQALTL